MNIQINIKDTATPALRGLIDKCKNTKSLHTRMATRVAVLFRKHFRNLNSTNKNAKGWPRQNFWNRFKNVTGRGDALSATVTIPDPQGALRHKFYGGTVRATQAKFLAIPLTAAAYVLGGRARYRDAFPNAFVLKTKKGAYLVQGGEGVHGRGNIKFLAKLVKSVTHKAFPEALPTPEQILETAHGAAADFLVK